MIFNKRAREIVSIGIIGCVVAIVNQLEVFIQWIQNDSDHVFTGIAHYYADYFLYVTQMAQGIFGNLLAYHRFTNEILPPIWIYWFNLLLGNIGNLMNFSPFVTYNVSLFLLVIALTYVWYYVASLLYPTQKIPRFIFMLFVLTSTNLFNIQAFVAKQTIELMGMSWFSPTLSLNRFGGVPHQIFQTILFVGLLIISVKLLEKTSSIRPKMVLLFTFMILLASSANPIQMLVFVTAFLSIALWLTYEKRSIDKKNMTVAGIVLAVSFLGAYMTNISFRDPLLAQAKAWESLQQSHISLLNLLLSVGPMSFFALFGLSVISKKLPMIQKLLFLYGILSLIFFFSPIPKLLGTSNLRFLHPAPYSMWAMLGVEGLIFLTKIFRALSKKRISMVSIQSIFLILYILFTIPSLIKEINDRVNPNANPILTSNLNHVPKTIVSSLVWLKQQQGKNPVVVTDPSLPYDVVIPVFTGKTSFTGHKLHTLYPEEKESLRSQLFQGKMTESELRSFLFDHRIGYLLMQNSNPAMSYFISKPYLYKAYDNGSIAIVSVRL